jgi:hypothetical protein
MSRCFLSDIEPSKKEPMYATDIHSVSCQTPKN